MLIGEFGLLCSHEINIFFKYCVMGNRKKVKVLVLEILDNNIHLFVGGGECKEERNF